MYPEDCVLVGVVNRQRDFLCARDQHWYRVPVDRMPRGGLYSDYIAFFLSGTTFGERSGGVHYYARRTGFELARRRDLLPEEASHPRADAVYYKLQFGALCEKRPPVVNSARRPVTFILTTWERFERARCISELYGALDRYDLYPVRRR
ncbi:MAG: hypothetical protein ACUVSX_00595 [Aggregatilineales bacterium]